MESESVDTLAISPARLARADRFDDGRSGDIYVSSR
jgi:hypothetical protein